jgi:hypothetical protein
VIVREVRQADVCKECKLASWGSRDKLWPNGGETGGECCHALPSCMHHACAHGVHASTRCLRRLSHPARNGHIHGGNNCYVEADFATQSATGVGHYGTPGNATDAWHHRLLMMLPWLCATCRCLRAKQWQLAAYVAFRCRKRDRRDAIGQVLRGE